MEMTASSSLTFSSSPVVAGGLCRQHGHNSLYLSPVSLLPSPAFLRLSPGFRPLNPGFEFLQPRQRQRRNPRRLHLQRRNPGREETLAETKPWQRRNPRRLHLQAPAASATAVDGSERAQLRLEGVCKRYGDRVVIKGISLDVQQGEVVGLLGPNGAGKSTAFRIMVGSERPSSGAVWLGGEEVTRLPLEARARRGVSYLPQDPSVFRGLSVRDNLLLVLQETGVPREAREGRLQELLSAFGLQRVELTRGAALSGGERRRTELARAVAANCSGGAPKIMLVDEPFAGVDPIGVSELQGILLRLCREEGMGILITDHNVMETLRICDRAYMVLAGEVMAVGSPEALYKDEFVRRHYLGESFFVHPLAPGSKSRWQTTEDAS